MVAEGKFYLMNCLEVLFLISVRSNHACSTSNKNEVEMVPSWVKKKVQAQVNKNLTEICHIERYSLESVGEYGETDPILISTTQYPCFLRAEKQAPDGMVTGADRGEVFYTLELPFDADIEDGDKIIIGTDTYETRQVMKAESQDVRRFARLVKAGA